MCTSLSTERNVPKALEVVHANRPPCLQGFSLKETSDVWFSEVLIGAKISAAGSLALEVPEGSILNLLGVLPFCPGPGLWNVSSVLVKLEGFYHTH